MKIGEHKSNHQFLVLLPAGIGDAVMIGASVIDQIVKNDPFAHGKIDLVCTTLQAEIFKADPRIGQIFCVSPSLFSTPDIRTWIKGVLLQTEALELLHSINRKRYQAVFPGSSTPFFNKHIHSPMINMRMGKIIKDILVSRSRADFPYSKITRRIINAHFGNKLPDPCVDEKNLLYVSMRDIRYAQAIVQNIKIRAKLAGGNSQLLVVAADTSSAITRPSTSLLIQSIAAVLDRKPHVAVCLLPGYSDPVASMHIYNELTARFGKRIYLFPLQPRLSLLEMTMVIDQADVFVTGDTGVMHLAVSNKQLSENTNDLYKPKNNVKIIVLFGGTNPALFGYGSQTVIVGKGRKEQRWLVPGILKEAYFLKNRDWFDHISPQQLTETIVGQLEIASIEHLATPVKADERLRDNS